MAGTKTPNPVRIKLRLVNLATSHRPTGRGAGRSKSMVFDFWHASMAGSSRLVTCETSRRSQVRLKWVRRALADAEQLLGTSGPASAIDRMHSALHGYLKTVCREQGIELPTDATLTLAYKTLRRQHPGLRSFGDHEYEAGRILSSFAFTLDALNTLRNHASVAHPNERLIGVAEGMLPINAVRTIFHYLNQKIAP